MEPNHSETERSIDPIKTINDLMKASQIRTDEIGRLYSLPNQIYATLEKDPTISEWLSSYAYDTKKRLRRGINALVDFTNMSPKELSELSGDDAKKFVKACMAKVKDENVSLAIDVMNASKAFFEYYNKKITFNRSERLRRTNSRIKYIPQKNAEVHAIAELASASAIPRSPKWKAMILMDWQTMLRENALLSARCGALMGYSENDCPIPIKVWSSNYAHSHGHDGVYVIDTKMSKYGLDYTYTFLSKEGFNAVMEYWNYREEKYRWSKKETDLIFVNELSPRRERDAISKQVLLGALKRGASKAGIVPEHIWVHLLRHAGKKVLIRANVDDEVREAIMAHKIMGSRMNYFDYHDMEQARKEYLKADWSRTGMHKIDAIEERNQELEVIVKEQDKRLRELEKDKSGKEGLMEFLERMYSSTPYGTVKRRKRPSVEQ